MTTYVHSIIFSIKLLCFNGETKEPFRLFLRGEEKWPYYLVLEGKQSDHLYHLQRENEGPQYKFL